MLVRDAFKRAVKLFPDRLAVVDENSRRTFREFDERINRLANALMGLGVTKGDRVGILLKNRSEYLEIVGAGAKTGIVVVPINVRLVEKELAYVIGNAQCQALILEPEFSGIINSARIDLEDLRHCISLGGPTSGMLSYESLLADASPHLDDMPLDESDLAMIMYTSGTTGYPKGAMSTQRILGERCLMSAIELSIRSDDRYLTVLPFFHIAMQAALSYLYMGATNYVLGDWDERMFCQMVERENITAMCIAPTILNFVVNFRDVDKYDLSGVRTILYGGSPMPEATMKAGIRLFSCNFVQGLGSTENYTSVILKPEDHVLEGTQKQMKRLTAAGREAVMCEARVVTEDGQDVSPGEVGEVITRGAGNLIGYWQNPEETNKKIRDGWYYTGDLATVDEDGYIFLVERKNDMIISGGENIYPKEVENVLYSHPSIFEAAVIGIPDDQWGESVKALVVLHEEESVSESEIIAFCKENLASYKKPRSVEFLDTLPRSPAGKVLKRDLREKYWKGRERKIG